MPSSARAAFVITASLLMGSVHAGAQQAQSIPAAYTVVEDFGVPEATVVPNALNNSGDVVGSFTTGQNLHSRAFLYRSGTFYDLGAWLGDNSVAVGINNRGDVLGQWQDVLGGTRGFLIAGATALDLGPMIPLKLNDAGQVLFFDFNTPFGSYNLRNADGSRTVVPFASATGLNDFGELVGTVVGPPPNFSNTGVIRYRDGHTINVPGFLPRAINNTPEIVGGNVVMQGSQFFPLPQFNGVNPTGEAINNNGLVVGRVAVGQTNHAIISDGSVTIDLNSLVSGTASPITLVYAAAVNDIGQILALGTDRGYLLSPFPAAQPDCGLDISAQLQTMRWDVPIANTVLDLQIVALKNVGPPINGTISYVMDGLANALYLGPQRVTACFSKTGDSFITVPVGSDNTFATGETVALGLWFGKKTFLEPQYVARVLNGTPVTVR